MLTLRFVSCVILFIFVIFVSVGFHAFLFRCAPFVSLLDIDGGCRRQPLPFASFSCKKEIQSALTKRPSVHAAVVTSDTTSDGGDAGLGGMLDDPVVLSLVFFAALAFGAVLFYWRVAKGKGRGKRRKFRR